MKLIKLLSCDIYRDGGSLEGIWLTDEDKEWAVTLKINSWDKPDEIKHYQMFHAGRNGIGKNPQIAKGSIEHATIRNLVDSWMAEHNILLADLEKERAGGNRLYDLLVELDRGNF